jgi:CubicO group peptidase (beta-lactamase class C family)
MRTVIRTALSVAASASILHAQNKLSATRVDSIDAYVRSTLTARQIPGAAIAIVDNGTVVFQRAYGLANVETETPVSLESVFELASVTKQFTAAAIMILVQDGKVQLDAPISTYVRDSPAEWRDITIRRLLTHTAGLPIDAIVGHDGSALLNIRTPQVFDMLRGNPLLSAPGSRFSYSDAGYFLLGMVIEAASGQSYREFLQRRVFDPVGMTATSILDRSRILKHRVSVYSLRGGTLANWRRDWQYELPSFFGVFSTVGDLVKWDNALRGRTLLTESSLAELWTPARLANGDVAGPGYGFGWYLVETGGHRVAEHPGASGTFLLHVIDEPLTIIVLTNLDGATGPSGAIIAHGIASIVDPRFVFTRR